MEEQERKRGREGESKRGGRKRATMEEEERKRGRDRHSSKPSDL
jgi:hypothetical protein